MTDSIIWKRVDTPDSDIPYYLYAAVDDPEGPLRIDPRSIPFVFSHGHNGGYRDFGAAFTAIERVQEEVNDAERCREGASTCPHGPLKIQPFALHFLGEPSAFSPALLHTQAYFIEDALLRIRQFYCGSRPVSECKPRAFLGGFSMGGAVTASFLAHVYEPFWAGGQGSLHTLPVDLPVVVKAFFFTSSPIRSHPAMLDLGTAVEYEGILEGLNKLQRGPGAVAILGVGSGPFDDQVIDPLFQLEQTVPQNTALIVPLPAAPQVYVSTSHIGAVGCGQYLLHLLAPSVCTIGRVIHRSLEGAANVGLGDVRASGTDAPSLVELCRPFFRSQAGDSWGPTVRRAASIRLQGGSRNLQAETGEHRGGRTDPLFLPAPSPSHTTEGDAAFVTAQENRALLTTTLCTGGPAGPAAYAAAEVTAPGDLRAHLFAGNVSSVAVPEASTSLRPSVTPLFPAGPGGVSLPSSASLLACMDRELPVDTQLASAKPTVGPVSPFSEDVRLKVDGLERAEGRGSPPGGLAGALGDSQGSIVLLGWGCGMPSGVRVQAAMEVSGSSGGDTEIVWVDITPAVLPVGIKRRETGTRVRISWSARQMCTAVVGLGDLSLRAAVGAGVTEKDSGVRIRLLVLAMSRDAPSEERGDHPVRWQGQLLEGPGGAAGWLAEQKVQVTAGPSNLFWAAMTGKTADRTVVRGGEALSAIPLLLEMKEWPYFLVPTLSVSVASRTSGPLLPPALLVFSANGDLVYGHADQTCLMSGGVGGEAEKSDGSVGHQAQAGKQVDGVRCLGLTESGMTVSEVTAAILPIFSPAAWLSRNPLNWKERGGAPAPGVLVLWGGAGVGAEEEFEVRVDIGVNWAVTLLVVVRHFIPFTLVVLCQFALLWVTWVLISWRRKEGAVSIVTLQLQGSKKEKEKAVSGGDVAGRRSVKNGVAEEEEIVGLEGEGETVWRARKPETAVECADKNGGGGFYSRGTTKGGGGRGGSREMLLVDEGEHGEERDGGSPSQQQEGSDGKPRDPPPLSAIYKDAPDGVGASGGGEEDETQVLQSAYRGADGYTPLFTPDTDFPEQPASPDGSMYPRREPSELVGGGRAIWQEMGEHSSAPAIEAGIAGAPGGPSRSGTAMRRVMSRGSLSTSAGSQQSDFTLASSEVVGVRAASVRRTRRRRLGTGPSSASSIIRGACGKRPRIADVHDHLGAVWLRLLSVGCLMRPDPASSVFKSRGLFLDRFTGGGPFSAHGRQTASNGERGPRFRSPARMKTQRGIGAEGDQKDVKKEEKGGGGIGALQLPSKVFVSTPPPESASGPRDHAGHLKAWRAKDSGEPAKEEDVPVKTMTTLSPLASAHGSRANLRTEEIRLALSSRSHLRANSGQALPSPAGGGGSSGGGGMIDGGGGGGDDGSPRSGFVNSPNGMRGDWRSNAVRGAWEEERVSGETSPLSAQGDLEAGTFEGIRGGEPEGDQVTSWYSSTQKEKAKKSMDEDMFRSEGARGGWGERGGGGPMGPQERLRIMWAKVVRCFACGRTREAQRNVPRGRHGAQGGRFGRDFRKLWCVTVSSRLCLFLCLVVVFPLLAIFLFDPLEGALGVVFRAAFLGMDWRLARDGLSLDRRAAVFASFPAWTLFVLSVLGILLWFLPLLVCLGTCCGTLRFLRCRGREKGGQVRETGIVRQRTSGGGRTDPIGLEGLRPIEGGEGGEQEQGSEIATQADPTQNGNIEPSLPPDGTTTTNAPVSSSAFPVPLASFARLRDIAEGRLAAMSLSPRLSRFTQHPASPHEPGRGQRREGGGGGEVDESWLRPLWRLALPRALSMGVRNGPRAFGEGRGREDRSHDVIPVVWLVVLVVALLLVPVVVLVYALVRAFQQFARAIVTTSAMIAAAREVEDAETALLERRALEQMEATRALQENGHGEEGGPPSSMPLVVTRRGPYRLSNAHSSAPLLQKKRSSDRGSDSGTDAGASEGVNLNRPLLSRCATAEELMPTGSRTWDETGGERPEGGEGQDDPGSPTTKASWLSSTNPGHRSAPAERRSPAGRSRFEHTEMEGERDRETGGGWHNPTIEVFFSWITFGLGGGSLEVSVLTSRGPTRQVAALIGSGLADGAFAALGPLALVSVLRLFWKALTEAAGGDIAKCEVFILAPQTSQNNDEVGVLRPIRNTSLVLFWPHRAGNLLARDKRLADGRLGSGEPALFLAPGGDQSQSTRVSRQNSRFLPAQPGPPILGSRGRKARMSPAVGDLRPVASSRGLPLGRRRPPLVLGPRSNTTPLPPLNSAAAEPVGRSARTGLTAYEESNGIAAPNAFGTASADGGDSDGEDGRQIPAQAVAATAAAVSGTALLTPGQSYLAPIPEFASYGMPIAGEDPGDANGGNFEASQPSGVGDSAASPPGCVASARDNSRLSRSLASSSSAGRWRAKGRGAEGEGVTARRRMGRERTTPSRMTAWDDDNAALEGEGGGEDGGGPGTASSVSVASGPPLSRGMIPSVSAPLSLVDLEHSSNQPGGNNDDAGGWRRLSAGSSLPVAAPPPLPPSNLGESELSVDGMEEEEMPTHASPSHLPSLRSGVTVVGRLPSIEEFEGGGAVERGDGKTKEGGADLWSPEASARLGGERGVGGPGGCRTVWGVIPPPPLALCVTLFLCIFYACVFVRELIYRVTLPLQVAIWGVTLWVSCWKVGDPLRVQSVSARQGRGERSSQPDDPRLSMGRCVWHAALSGS
uniref:GPI inositol-deacylase PGAP1-like alpha/beta domain-containing protein n=1 Tax=Chromera velia CCMP2878 TaxID=1169474 RepID=A0A0G4I793_9ALVE|eukprot:Cvel_11542.t1-p1 / transcript=Cvel_11542.t1 / gene=Cvel_11542 / organism=Chromera_velia_CCMP2878 / gene_product=hypothetical protein / transcript_product=hypothetical protein / location=Cvel_scaffold729:4579-14865(-) / protein_length=2696 / sequence_SO=supercontig / SO=protein_coding / is_pseudo=false